jgi:hypothetical protein
MQEMVESLQRDHVRISRALEAQHDEADVLVLAALLELIEATVQFRSRAKKELNSVVSRNFYRRSAGDCVAESGLADDSHAIKWART